MTNSRAVVHTIDDAAIWPLARPHERERKRDGDGVVEPGLGLEQPHDARAARAGAGDRREDGGGIGGREHRAEQERLRPVERREYVGVQRDEPEGRRGAADTQRQDGCDLPANRRQPAAERPAKHDHRGANRAEYATYGAADGVRFIPECPAAASPPRSKARRRRHWSARVIAAPNLSIRVAAHCQFGERACKRRSMEPGYQP